MKSEFFEYICSFSPPTHWWSDRREMRQKQTQITQHSSPLSIFEGITHVFCINEKLSEQQTMPSQEYFLTRTSSSVIVVLSGQYYYWMWVWNNAAVHYFMFWLYVPLLSLMTEYSATQFKILPIYNPKTFRQDIWTFIKLSSANLVLKLTRQPLYNLHRCLSTLACKEIF